MKKTDVVQNIDKLLLFVVKETVLEDFLKNESIDF